jgi:hypothetical protein
MNDSVYNWFLKNLHIAVVSLDNNMKFIISFRYQCGIARAFTDSSLSQDFYCDWSGKWLPSDQLKQCACKSNSFLLNECVYVLTMSLCRLNR